MPPAPRMRSGGPGCARSGALAADGLGLIRLEPGRSTSPPCLALSAPAPPSWGLGDLPETLRPEHWVGAEIPRSSVCPGFGSLAQRGLGLPPPAAFPSPAPSLRVSGRPPPCSPRGGWVPRGWGARASPSTGRAGLRPRPAGLPPVHLEANATRGAVRLPARYPVSVCLRVQSRGSVCPHRRRTEQGRRQSYVRRGGRGGRGGGGAERGSGGAGGGEARRAGDSGGRRRHAASPFAHRGLRRPQHGREARRPVSRGRSQPGRPRTAVGAPRHGPSRGRGPGPGATAAAAASGGYAGPCLRGRAG